jgi:single-strand DNA-binding protein
MAASVNKVIIVGNLGRDPETRYTNTGTSVTNFSVATTDSFSDKSGGKRERTEWHNIVAWGKLGELCTQYLKKGRQVYIEGRISYREYEAKDGTGKRKATEIVAQSVQFLGGRGESDFASGGGGQMRGGSTGSSGGSGGGGGDEIPPIDDEDIPF